MHSRIFKVPLYLRFAAPFGSLLRQLLAHKFKSGTTQPYNSSTLLDYWFFFFYNFIAVSESLLKMTLLSKITADKKSVGYFFLIQTVQIFRKVTLIIKKDRLSEIPFLLSDQKIRTKIWLSF